MAEIVPSVTLNNGGILAPGTSAGTLTISNGQSVSGQAQDNADNLVTSVDNSGTPGVPHVVLIDGYDNLGRRTSLSSSVASTADFMDNFGFDALDRETQVKQQSQTGGNAVAPKLVNFTYNGDSQFVTIGRYADLTGTNLVATSIHVK